MEEHDNELIRELIKTNQELATLWKEHQEFEERLEDMNQRLFLTPEEEMQRKQLQKQKLVGRDRIELILAEHRASQNKG